MLIPFPRIWGIRNLLNIPATLYRILVRFVKNGRAIILENGGAIGKAGRGLWTRTADRDRGPRTRTVDTEIRIIVMHTGVVSH